MGVAGSQGPRALSAPRDLGLLRRIGACGGVWGEGQPRTGLWKFRMVIPGCRFARPQAIDRMTGIDVIQFCTPTGLTGRTPAAPVARRFS